MLYRTVSFHLFFSCFMSACASVREFTSQHVLSMKDKILPNDLLKITSTTSKLNCAVDCVIEPTCIWVSYNPGERICRFHTVPLELVDTGAQTIISNGWRSYSFYESWCPIHKGFVFIQSLDLCYKAIPGKVLCTTSVSLCVAEGSRPLILDSAEKQNFIESLLDNRSDMDSAWMDAVLSGGQWYWYDSRPVANTYTNWDLSQPQNLPGCLVIRKLFSYKWHDYETNFSFDTICEIRRLN